MYTISSEEVLPKLRLKLATLEPTIKEIIALGRPTSILKEKLTQVEGLVMEIPDETVHFVIEWRSKLAHWYMEYSALLSVTELGALSVSSKLNQSMSINNNQPPFQSSNYTPTVADNRSSLNRNYGQLEHFIGSKEAVRAQLEAAFTLLPTMDSFNKFDLLRNFAKLVSKADERIEPFWRDRKLQEFVMEQLRKKMPSEKWDQFTAFVGDEDKLTIRNLKRFIIRQLCQVLDEQRQLAEASQAVKPDEVNELLECSFCRNVGHLVENCNHILFSICYCCFEEGHKKSRCPKEAEKRRQSGW